MDNKKIEPKDDKIWETIREEIKIYAKSEPILTSFLYETILNHETLEDALSFHLANKINYPTVPVMLIRELIKDVIKKDPTIGISVRKDIQAIRERDPASQGYSTPFLYFKGFHALQLYRISHWLWKNDRKALALYLQNRISEEFGVDIHPASKIGSGILIDHATSVVIGETTIIEDNVSLLHEVTLGGTGKEVGDRHPKIREGVLIGAGAKILGNIEIGKGAKIGSGSVVLSDVPPHHTVAGVPAKIIGKPKYDQPALMMNHKLHTMNTDD